MSGYVTVWCSHSWTAKYFNCIAVHFFLAKQMMKIVIIIILQLYKNSKKQNMAIEIYDYTIDLMQR